LLQISAYDEHALIGDFIKLKVFRAAKHFFPFNTKSQSIVNPWHAVAEQNTRA
jgi:hypothetical protein